MMELLYISLPEYTSRIIDKIKKANWLCHPFSFDNKNDVYDPTGYLSNVKLHNITYVIYLDLNIYQYILSSIKKTNKNNLHRDAISLVIFAQLIKADFEPNLAIYEKLNYSKQCPDELIDDYTLFQQIDNAHMDDLAKFALGDTDEIYLQKTLSVNKGELKQRLTKFDRLKHWDSYYLFSLKISELYFYNKGSNEEKINHFLQWCIDDFLTSLIATSFTINLMGKKPLPKLMKYDPKQNKEKKKRALINMTWDLFFLGSFFQSWKGKEKNKEFLYASNDKSLKETLSIAKTIQLEENFNQLTNYISSSLVAKLNNLNITAKETKNRKIDNTKNFSLHRKTLIAHLEGIVL